MNKKVYVVDAKRSPIGKFLGGLSSLSPSVLMSQVIKSILDNNQSIPKEDIDEVIIGNVLSAGQGQNIGRQASILAGIPEHVPAYTLNMVCGSGMKSIINSYNAIKSGEADVILAGGVEVMSKANFIVDGKMRFGNRMGNLDIKDEILIDGLTDYFNNYHMGITAENIVDKYSISRKEQDLFAIDSQKKAINSVDKGIFKEEIVSIEVSRKNESFLIDSDEYPNRETSYEKLSKLKPAFKKDGTITAGNSSGINDGAAILLLVSENALNKYKLRPLAEIIAYGQGGVDPSLMGMGPVNAINNLLSKIDYINIRDIDLFELNEAFAAQSLGVINELKNKYKIEDNWFEERTNVNGGAIALGHPLGASGCRIITTLIYEMKRRNSGYGLAALCIGGGMGTAMLIKSI